MNIKNFNQYKNDLMILNDFLDNSESPINEIDSSSIKKIVDDILNDLVINLKFVSTFILKFK